MHILLIGYGKTSRHIAQYLFEQDHKITTINPSPKIAREVEHLMYSEGRVGKIKKLDNKNGNRSCHFISDEESGFFAFEPTFRLLGSDGIQCSF